MRYSVPTDTRRSDRQNGPWLRMGVPAHSKGISDGMLDECDVVSIGLPEGGSVQDEATSRTQGDME